MLLAFSLSRVKEGVEQYEMREETPYSEFGKEKQKQSKLSSILSLQAQVYYCLSLVSFEFYTSYIVSHTSQKCLKKLKYPNTSLKLITTLTPTTITSSQAYSRHDGSSFTCDGNDLILHDIKPYTFLTMLHHYLPPPSFTCRVSGVGRTFVVEQQLQNYYRTTTLEMNF